MNGGGADAFLGDFFGLVRFFEKYTKPEFLGEFGTAEHPTAYFNRSHHADIKFGGDTVLTKFEVVLTKAQGGMPNWQYVGPDDILNHLFAWMATKCDPSSQYSVQAGDSVIIILLAHGHGDRATSMPDGCILGTKNLFVSTFVEKLRQFPRNVQVNVISNSCYSGLFAEKIEEDAQQDRFVVAASKSGPLDRAWPGERSASNRFRNGLFIAGLVRSLGGFQTTRTNPTIAKLKDELADATRSHPDPTKRSEPSFYNLQTEETLVGDLLFKKFADFPLSQQNIAARRRLELETEYLNRYPNPTSGPAPMTPPTQGQSFALQVIRAESEAFGMNNTPQYIEVNFAQYAMFSAERFLPDILRGLVWRGRWQSNVFQLFMILVLHGHCSLSALEKPIDYSSMTETTMWMHNALMSFSALNDLYKTGSEVVHLDEREVQWHEFRYPIVWLETMIVRSAVNISNTFDCIAVTNLLGPIDKSHFVKVPKLDRKWTPLPDEVVASVPQDPPCFGMMLPSGIDLQGRENPFLNIQKEFYERLNMLEKAFDEYFIVPISERRSLEYQQDREVDQRDWTPWTPPGTLSPES